MKSLRVVVSTIEWLWMVITSLASGVLPLSSVESSVQKYSGTWSGCMLLVFGLVGREVEFKLNLRPVVFTFASSKPAFETKSLTVNVYVQLS
jgi:hypothetical protein